MSGSTALSNDHRLVYDKSAWLPSFYIYFVVVWNDIQVFRCEQKKKWKRKPKLNACIFFFLICDSGDYVYLCIYEVNGDMPTCRGSVGTEPGSKFFINSVNQCLVDLSSCRHAVNVASRSWSGKHWRKASRALEVDKSQESRKILLLVSDWAS